VYGNELKKELERVCIDHDEHLKCSMLAYMSNSKYTQLKQMIFILFINERLVDCQPIKKTLQSLFSLYLPKNTNPFVYMSLTIDAKNLDVNIHPTKHEVRFLYQDEIIARIQTYFEQKLLDSSVSRTFYVKNLTIDAYVSRPEKNVPTDEEDNGDEDGSKKENKKPEKIVYPYQLTRVDTKERKLDEYFHTTTGLDESIRNIKEKSSQDARAAKDSATNETDPCAVKSALRNQKLDRLFNFLSLQDLRDSVETNSSKSLRLILSNYSFVGCLDRELALVQHQTGLYIMNTHILSRELFYQLALFNIGNFGYFGLAEPASVTELAMMGLDDPSAGWSAEDGPKEKLARRCAKFLLSKAAMLDDYFSIKIVQQQDSGDICVEALPMLVEDYVPDLVELPTFLLRLATEVEWDDEKECLEGVCNELGLFYAHKNLKYEPGDDLLSSSAKTPDEQWLVEHVLYKAFANMLLPSSENEKQAFYKLVDLSKLYKVFERC
jgi:DNA mismatch repair protein MLH1